MNSEEIEIIGRDELRRLKQELQDLKEYGGEVIGEYEKQVEKLKVEIKLLDDNNNYLNNRIDKAIEILALCNSKCSKEVIEILKGSDKE